MISKCNRPNLRIAIKNTFDLFNAIVVEQIARKDNFKVLVIRFSKIIKSLIPVTHTAKIRRIANILDKFKIRSVLFTNGGRAVC